jgi:hypothetical protein
MVLDSWGFCDASRWGGALRRPTAGRKGRARCGQVRALVRIKVWSKWGYHMFSIDKLESLYLSQSRRSLYANLTESGVGRTPGRDPLSFKEGLVARRSFWPSCIGRDDSMFALFAMKSFQTHICFLSAWFRNDIFRGYVVQNATGLDLVPSWHLRSSFVSVHTPSASHIICMFGTDQHASRSCPMLPTNLHVCQNAWLGKSRSVSVCLHRRNIVRRQSTSWQTAILAA